HQRCLVYDGALGRLTLPWRDLPSRRGRRGCLGREGRYGRLAVGPYTAVAQVLGGLAQAGRVTKTVVWIFGRHLLQQWLEIFQATRQTRPRTMDMLQYDVNSRVTLKRSHPHEHLIQDDAQAINIGPAVDRAPQGLLWTEVMGSSDLIPRSR